MNMVILECQHSALPPELMSALCVSEATLMLAEGIEDAEEDGSVEPSAVQYCVEHGADVMYLLPQKRMPILHALTIYGLMESIKEALKTPNTIDFRTKTPENGNTLLHWIASYTVHSDIFCTSLMKLIVERLNQAPGDRIDWFQKNDKGYSFLSKAARCQKLSLLWPIVEDMVIPYFRPLLDDTHMNTSALPKCTILLDAGVWRADWERLNAEHRACFRIVESNQSFREADIQVSTHIEGMNLKGEKEMNDNETMNSLLISADEPTRRLFRQSRLRSPEINEVRRCVEKGADALFAPIPYCNEPVLHTFIRFGHIVCLEACLQNSVRPIDFTRRDYAGNTPLHYVCEGAKTSETVERILRIVIKRTNDNNVIDTIDWGAKNDEGYDFLSLSAYFDKLSVVWRVLQEKKVPFFCNHSSGRMVLDLPVGWKDFRQLSMEQRLKQFKMTRKFK